MAKRKRARERKAATKKPKRAHEVIRHRVFPNTLFTDQSDQHVT